MRTQFKSNQHNVSTYVLRHLFPVGISNTETLSLEHIGISFKGHGYYKVIVDVVINGVADILEGDTSSMQTIDCWREGEDDLDSNIYDSWEDVVYSLLYAVDFEEKVEQLAISLDEIRPNALDILEEVYSSEPRLRMSLKFTDWVHNELESDPNFEQWLFYRAENIGDFGSGKTINQSIKLFEFLNNL